MYTISKAPSKLVATKTRRGKSRKHGQKERLSDKENFNFQDFHRILKRSRLYEK